MEMHLRRLLGPHIDFDLQYQWNIPDIIGDPDSLACLFSDVTRNAASALRNVPLPEFRIETFTRNGYVVICMADNGCGMEPALRSAILAGESTPRSFDPTSSGLGMGFIRRTIAQFGGRMEIMTAPGQGTTFEFYFPAAGSTAAPKRG
jgi:signal transduction histidine kinase